MKYKFVNKPDICPKCGSNKIAPILYGLPQFSPVLRQKIRENKIVLGGCCVSNDSPSWKCVACNTVIYKMEIDYKDSVN